MIGRPLLLNKNETKTFLLFGSSGFSKKIIIKLLPPSINQIPSITYKKMQTGSILFKTNEDIFFTLKLNENTLKYQNWNDIWHLTNTVCS